MLFGLSFFLNKYTINNWNLVHCLPFRLVPNVVLGDFKIRFVNEIKYLVVFLNSKLRDDEDINRQVRYLYGTAYRLKHAFIRVRRK